jgi:hypothetical protein
MTFHMSMAVAPPKLRVIVHTVTNTYLAMKSVDVSFNVVDAVCIEGTAHSRVKVQKQFQMKRNACTKSADDPCDQHFGARSLWSVEGFYADTFNNCVHNEIISLEGRVGKHLPQHDDPHSVLREWMVLERDMLPEMLRHIEPVTTPMKFEKWVSTFPPHKRRTFTRLKEDGYELKATKVASSFIKQELVMRREGALDKHKDPRMIQGCPPELTLACGPYLRKVASHFKSGLKPSKHNIPGSVADGRHIVYTCGMNAVDIGRWFGMALSWAESVCGPGEWPVVVEDDESRYDEHMTEGPFQFMDSYYRHNLPKHVREHLRRTDKSKGKTSLGTKYSVPFTMQSGWPDTATADSIVNAAMKMSIHQVGRRWIAIICGDDSVTITVNTELTLLGGAKGIEAAYAKLGMECEVVIRDDPLKTEFCSSRFMPTGDTFVLVPKIGKFFGRLGWDRVDRSVKGQLAWGRGILETVRSYSRVDPTLEALVATLEPQIGVGPKIQTYEMVNTYTFTPPEGQYVPKATEDDVLLYYATHYDMDKELYDVLMREITQIRLGTPAGGPVLAHLCDCDC